MPAKTRLTAATLVVLTLLAGAAAPPTAWAQAPRTITLERPRPGTVVAAPVEVRGRVTVGPFENTLRGRVYDRAGRVVGQGPISVTPDAPEALGGAGSFAGRLPVTAGVTGAVRVEVADVSAADGRVLASASAAVILGPARLPATGAGPRGPAPVLAAVGLALLSLSTAVRRRAAPGPDGPAAPPRPDRPASSGTGSERRPRRGQRAVPQPTLWHAPGRTVGLPGRRTKSAPG